MYSRSYEPKKNKLNQAQGLLSMCKIREHLSIVCYK